MNRETRGRLRIICAEDRALGRATWRLDLVYEGTAYHGWARQPRQRTVEGVIEEALATVLREPVRLSVAGRTDAGVHALAQVASFICARHDLRPDRLLLSLNALLPPDVAVTPSRRRRRASRRARRRHARISIACCARAVRPVRRPRLRLERARRARRRAACRGGRPAARAARLRGADALRAPLSQLRARGAEADWQPTAGSEASSGTRTGSSRSAPTAFCTTWCAWPSDRWSTSRRGACRSRSSPRGWRRRTPSHGADGAGARPGAGGGGVLTARHPRGAPPERRVTSSGTAGRASASRRRTAGRRRRRRRPSPGYRPSRSSCRPWRAT